MPAWKTRPIWSAIAARVADWPWLAGAWGSLEHDLALREAYEEPAGRSLHHLVFDMVLYTSRRYSCGIAWMGSPVAVTAKVAICRSYSVVSSPPSRSRSGHCHSPS